MARENPDKNEPDNSEDRIENDHESQRKPEERTSITEKIFTVFSVILITGLCLFLLSQSFSTPTPPAFTTESSYVIDRGSFSAVDVSVRNRGEQAAKAVHISAELTGADGQPVEAEATMDWLPGNSKRQVTLLFPADVQKSGKPEIRIKGYEEP